MKHSSTMEERFWAKVDKREFNECWNWTACVNNQGYGLLAIKKVLGKMVLAHRFSYELNKGEINVEKPNVCHRCDNPRCVNPEHLFLGTQKDNLSDAANKQRMLGPRKLSIENVKFIRESPISTRSLARVFNVSHQAISLARRGHTWKIVKNSSLHTQNPLLDSTL